jgi:hypothetical protein
MTIEEVEDYFGNLNQTCKALGITGQNMTKWRKQAYIPYKQQFRLAYLTNGDLLPDDEDPSVHLRKGKKNTGAK